MKRCGKVGRNAIAAETVLREVHDPGIDGSADSAGRDFAMTPPDKVRDISAQADSEALKRQAHNTSVNV